MYRYIIPATTFAMNAAVILTFVAIASSPATIAKGETNMIQVLLKNERDELATVVIPDDDDTQLYPDIMPGDSEANCLALNVYYEARSDNLAGMYAVSDVVLNRVRNDRYPNTICEVVKQGPTKESWKTKQDPDLAEHERKFNPIRNMCQFSWYCDGKDDVPDDETGWATAQYVAGSLLYSNKHRGITEGATHYHATYVNPRWAHDRGMNHIGRIGSHIFYRWD